MNRRRFQLSLLAFALASAMAMGLYGDSTAPSLRYVPNEAFGFGERLEYDVGYKFISAGTAVFQIQKDPYTVQSRPCYKVSFEVKSHKSLEFIYRVTDTYTTWLDVDGMFPWQYTQRTREKNYSKDFKAVFNQVDHSARTSDGEFEIPPFVHDIVSAFYYVRTQDLKTARTGDVFRLKNFHDTETHNLVVRVLGRTTIEVEAGTFRCVVIEPQIESGSPFGFEGRLVMWMSDDDRKIPIKVSTSIPIGTIDAELRHYSGTRGKIDAKVN
jgi:hypothetical protein